MIIKCPNCQQNISVKHGQNRWAEWFKGECETCGYNFSLKDKHFDFIQPSSPFFKEIYKHHPEKEYEKNRKEAEWKEQKRKEELQKKYWGMGKKSQKPIKPWERRNLEKIVLKED